MVKSEAQADLQCGLTAYLAPDFAYRIYKTGEWIVADKLVGDMYVVAYRMQVKNDTVHFYIRADKTKYELGYILNGRRVCAAEGTTQFLCTGVAGKCFTGALMGVFAQGKGEAAVTDLWVTAPGL